MIVQEGWLKRIGGIATLENFGEFTTESAMDFHFTVSMNKHQVVLQKFSPPLFLDSAYNTCYALDDPERKVFLHTIVFNYDVAGHEGPLAFMLQSNPRVLWKTGYSGLK